jgi:RND superfamily putative drug exporter
MSRALEHLGRFAARRPWIVIGSWVAIGFLVITSAAAFGRDLEDPFEAPGLDSHRATELLAQAGSAEVGLGADVVLTPRDPETSFFDSPAARADVARIQEAVAALPKVLATTDPAAALRVGRQAAVESGVVSPDGEVALIRIQYPERQHLEPDDLANVQGAHEAPGRAELFDGWYPRIDAPIKGRTVLDTSGHRPLFEQPDDFLDYLTDVVVPSTAQLPRS